MPNSAFEERFPPPKIRLYISKKYSIGEFELLCHNDEDQNEANRLIECFEKIAKELPYDNKILEVIKFAKRREKYDILVTLLRENRPNFERDFDAFVADLEAIKVHSSAPTAEYDPRTIRNDGQTNGKASSPQRGNSPFIVKPKSTAGSTSSEVTTFPQIDSLNRDLAHMEQNLVSLNEVSDLLNVIRQKIEALMEEIRAKHQSTQSEWQARKAKPFQPEPRPDRPMSRANFERRQPTPTPGRGWGETPYS